LGPAEIENETCDGHTQNHFCIDLAFLRHFHQLHSQKIVGRSHAAPRNGPASCASIPACSKLGKQLARERGDTHRTDTGAGGMRDFVRDCVRGKQSWDYGGIRDETQAQICRDDAGKAPARPASGWDRPALLNHGARRRISRHNAASHQANRCLGPLLHLRADCTETTRSLYFPLYGHALVKTALSV
jgi:hypothetical protein